MQPRFVVTGCSRSGTKYTGALLTTIGIPCGHEEVFGPWTGALHLTDPFVMRPDLVGDSSFLAVPYLERLGQGDWVFHQLRDPLEVIRSHIGIQFFPGRSLPSVDLAGSRRHYLAIVKDFLPDIFEPDDQLTRTVQYWIQWNKAVEKSVFNLGLNYRRYRVEDLDTDLLAELVRALGRRVGRRVLANGLSGVSRNMNTRKREEAISWETLAELPEDVRADLAALADRYDYSVGV